ncbi:hypothetical protein CSQ89_11225 [Chitinimonas sp. BJB300]|nr:hypothetical protein CSQ89_11225 [Chitinimonas sp. BJB300]
MVSQSKTPAEAITAPCQIMHASGMYDSAKHKGQGFTGLCAYVVMLNADPVREPLQICADAPCKIVIGRDEARNPTSGS